MLRSFEDDRERTHLDVTCLEGGQWDEPEVWPTCVAGEMHQTG